MIAHSYVGVLRRSQLTSGYVFHADNMPPSLSGIYIELWAVRSAKDGDCVRVEYREIGGAWQYVVAEVLP